MISPSKHSDPDRTSIYLASRILRHIRSTRLLTYDDSIEFARKQVTGAEFLILPALDLLFLLGLIEYRRKTDSFEYVGKT